MALHTLQALVLAVGTPLSEHPIDNRFKKACFSSGRARKFRRCLSGQLDLVTSAPFNISMRNYRRHYPLSVKHLLLFFRSAHLLFNFKSRKKLFRDMKGYGTKGRGSPRDTSPCLSHNKQEAAFLETVSSKRAQRWPDTPIPLSEKGA